MVKGGGLWGDLLVVVELQVRGREVISRTAGDYLCSPV